MAWSKRDRLKREAKLDGPTYSSGKRISGHPPTAGCDGQPPAVPGAVGHGGRPARLPGQTPVDSKSAASPTGKTYTLVITSMRRATCRGTRRGVYPSGSSAILAMISNIVFSISCLDTLLALSRRSRFFVFRHGPLLYNVLKSSGTSPNFSITLASPNSPVAGLSAERNGSHMSRFARQRFRAHDDRHRIEAFGWFAGRNAIVGSDKGQRHEVGHFCHSSRS